MPLIERSNVVDADASVVPKLCRSEGDDGVLASVAEAMLKRDAKRLRFAWFNLIQRRCADESPQV